MKSTHLIFKSICTLTILILLLTIVPFATPVSAASVHTVNSAGDTGDSNLADGICSDGSGCTLRAAIQQSNHNVGPDTILFEDSYTITPFSPLPPINDLTGGTTIKMEDLYVSIDGQFAGPGVDGFLLSSHYNKIQNLNIFGFNGNGVKITGNYNIIGVDGDGITDAYEWNQIHSNGANGILSLGTGTRISGNQIGFNGKPNASNGIELGGSNQIVGVNGDGISDHLESNTIAYNNANGIFDHGTESVIAGNVILNNVEHGVFLSLGGSIRVGTDGNGLGDNFEGNRISGNHKSGVSVYNTSNVTIAGNKIGVNSAGTSASPNYDYGIFVQESFGAIIGTNGGSEEAPIEGNLVSGNYDGQVYLLYSMMATVAGNKIGTNITGSAALSPAQGFGIKLEHNGFSGCAVRYNTISGTGWYGMQINKSDNNTVSENTIGLDLSGRKPVPNDGNGIEIVNGSTQNILSDNLIAGNDGNGILVYGSNNNRFRGNKIGTNADGNVAFGNTFNGILIQNSRLNVIGTDSIDSINHPYSNLISGNLGSGIKLDYISSPVSNNSIYSNRIGTIADGNGKLPNLAYGIHLVGQSVDNNIIQANLIANHPGSAVRLDGLTQTTGNAITHNRMLRNQSGITIEGAGVNDMLDADTGPNGKQNHPLLTFAEKENWTVGVNLSLHSTPTTLFNFHFYLTRLCSANQSDSNQGEIYLGDFQAVTDASGNFVGAATVGITAQDVSQGPNLLVTATNSGGSTSEFSNCIPVKGLYHELFQPMIVY